MDAEILAEVYLEMNGGRQQNINLVANSNNMKKIANIRNKNYSKKIYKVSEQEEKKHKKLLEFINNF